MLNEVNPNLPPERTSRFEGIGRVEIAFAAGFVLAIVGLALVAIPAALLAAGVLLMAVAWRFA